MATYSLTEETYRKLEALLEKRGIYLVTPASPTLSYIVQDPDETVRRAKGAVARANKGEGSVASIESNPFNTAYKIRADDMNFRTTLEVALGLKPETPGSTYKTPASSRATAPPREYAVGDGKNLAEIEKQSGLHIVPDPIKPFRSYLVPGVSQDEQRARGYLASVNPGEWAAAVIDAGRIANGRQSQVTLTTRDATLQNKLQGMQFSEASSSREFSLTPAQFQQLQHSLTNYYFTATKRTSPGGPALAAEFRRLDEPEPKRNETPLPPAAKVAFVYGEFGGSSLAEVRVTTSDRDIIIRMPALLKLSGEETQKARRQG